VIPYHYSKTQTCLARGFCRQLFDFPPASWYDSPILATEKAVGEQVSNRHPKAAREI
jgi:hypothetical protein